MVKKLLLKVIIFWALILTSAVGWGQDCATGPTNSATASISLQGSSSICSDKSISFTTTNLNLDGGTSPYYQWQKQVGTGNWADIAGENSTTLSNYTDVQNNTKFRLAIIFCNNTADEEIYLSNTSSTITVVQSTVATISISANNTVICPGTSVSFSKSPTNQGSSPSYSWRVNGTEVSTSANFSYDQFTDGDTVQVFMISDKACATDGNDADGDNAAESNIINITVKEAIPDQPGTISGPTILCSNTAATYSITAVERATSYQWILPTGWAGTSNTTSINITSGNLANGQVIRVKAINDCGESTESALTMDVGPGIPSNPGTISGSGLICPGDTVTFSVNQDPDVNSYTWSLPANWSIQGVSDGASITAIAGGANDDGTVQVFSSNDCENSSTSSLSVNVNDPVPADPGTISGPTTVCPNTNVNYSISAINYADKYIWYVDNTELSGQTGTSVNINSGATGTRNLKVIAVNECVDPADYSSLSGSSLQITVDDGTPGDTFISQSSPDGSSGNTELCPTETGFKFSVPQDARIDNYNWSVPTGWTITAGTGTHEIIVTSGELGNDGNVEFSGTSNVCGSVTTTYAVSVKNPAPVITTETISGEAKVCRDATGLIYTVPNIQYADNYVWSVPPNWVINNGRGTNTITVSAGSDDGNITVYAQNDCGETSTLSFAVESVDAVPAPPGTIESTDAFEADPKICPPLNPLYLTVPYVSDDISYNWTLPTGWEIIGDETSNEININVTSGGTYNVTETVQVTATNGCFISDPTTSFAMTISDYIITDLGDDQTVCSTINQISIPGEIRFGNSKKFNPTYTAVNGNGTDVSGNLSGLPTNFNSYPNTFNITYNATAADQASGSVKVSVQVPPPATTGQDPNACGTGYAEMTIFFRPAPTASISATAEICEGQTGEVTFSGTANSTITYNINSGTSQTIEIGDTGESTVTTAALSGDTTYSITSIQYTEAPNCSTTMSESATIVVNPRPTVDISYANHCSSETTPAMISYSNEIGAWQTGTFSATGALGSEIQSDGSFIPANVAPGTYTVTYEITGSGGCENVSVTTEVTVFEKVSITKEPSDQRTCEGGNAEFQVNATGEGLSYQWYKGTASAGNEIAGATGSKLSLTNVSVSDAGEYLVVVNGTDPCSPDTSILANLTVNQNIIIDTQPADLTVCEGENSSLTVSASVGGDVLDNTYTYQWFKGNPGAGTAISGMNSKSLPLNSVSTDDSGSYYVEITGPAEYECSKIVSEAAVIDVKATPTVQISEDTSICSGESTNINFFSGIPGNIVKYRLNGDNNNQPTIVLDSNGEAVLNTGPLHATNNTDTTFDYEIISVAYPDSPSCTQTFTTPLPTATITVAANPDVSISFTDDQTEFCTADNSQYTPSLDGTGVFSGGTWSANGITINSSTGAFTPGAETAGNYTINYTIPAYGGCAEETIILDISIYEEVIITSQPTNLGICSTNDAEFFIGASGDGLTYQWYKNGNPISGATSPTLSLPVATSEDAGDYYAVVSGTSACTPAENSKVQSETVTLNVDEDIVIIEPAEDVRVCDDTNASVEFKFVAHANGAPLIFEWIYSDGTPVNPENKGNMQASLVERAPTAEELANFPEIQDIQVYEGTLTISSITSADQASYAVKIDGSANNFNCSEAISNSFNLDVDPLPNAPTSTSLIEYCLGETAEILTATGEAGATFTWYDSNNNELFEAPTPDTSTPGDIIYYVTQKDTYCESPQTTVTVTIFDTPASPVLTDEEKQITYCLGETATALSVNLNGAASANWYDSQSSTTPLSGAPIPQTTAPGDINYWVTFVNDKGCESDKAMITVHTSVLPDIVLPEDQEICEGDTFQVTASDSKEISENTTTYSWNWEGNTGDPLTGAQQDLAPVETTTFTVTATNANGCTITAQITINVDPQPAGGTLDGPGSVCITNPAGDLNLTNFSGTIVQWESKAQSASTWTAINENTPDANYQFSGLTETTSFRVLVGNGVCEEVYSIEWTVQIDPEPIAGQILFKGTERVFMMCEFPTADYLVPLQTTGTYVGEIVAWHYRRSSATDWSVIKNTDGTNFTGTTLSGQQVNAATNNESTLFRVEVQSGACSPNVFSDNATLSIIPSDIAPNPVTVTRESICLGESISLSSGTGYGGNGMFEGAAFDNSSIANHGWRVMRYGSNNDGTEYTFESAANNVRPDRWQRTNPKEFMMAGPSGNISQLFDTSLGTEGNKGFAIVSGDNPSTLETPVFNTFTMDNPTLTFDQAYNLTAGDVIRVQISLDGGATYESVPLLEITGPATSGNYASFGDGDPQSRPNNKMSIPLDQYAGLPNLRIRWLYDGSTGGIYAIDAIGVPQDPENVQLIWYYDEDPDNPDNTLEPIGEVNQSTVSFTPDKIGWNYFEVQTALVFDTNGDPCQSAENMATIRIYVFDSYSTTATANVGSCGSTEVPLKGILTGGTQGDVNEFPVGDDSTLAWSVISSPDGYTFSESHFSPSVNDPNAIFIPPIEGPYTLSWKITPDEDNTCTITNGEVTFNFAQCTTLDFDGVDDHVIVADSYSTAQTIETWIRPETENGPGSGKVASIFSSQNYELFLNASGSPVLIFNEKRYTSSKSLNLDDRWYHIAVVLSNPVQMFIDGIEVNVPNTTSSDELGTGGQFVIGGRYNGDNVEPDNYFSGWIDELRIWNTPLTEKQIRFMMNQRIKLDGSGIVASPLSGEVVPNLSVAGSYHINGTNNLDKDDDAFFDVPASSLIGYYRLISASPDPLGVYNFANNLKPSGGLTPDHSSVSKVDGRLYNIHTDQENSSPTPYVSWADNQTWATDNTWAYHSVWDTPNSLGIDGSTPIEWNIARINHNINSSTKDITMLGILSETPDKILTIDPDHFIRVSHYLLLHGNMDLVGESQLLQDHGSILAEESAGWLQRDQQGKLMSFNYNYWSSPVSDQGSTPNNAPYTVAEVLKDGTNPNNPAIITFLDPYAAADQARTTPLTISNYWIWKFKGAASLYEDWLHIGSGVDIFTGEGYTMKGTDGTVSDVNAEQNYVFEGKPHNGTIKLNLVDPYQNYLIGNPYSSALNADEFIKDNIGVRRSGKNIFNGALYFWDHFDGQTHYLQEYVGGYATYNLSGGVEAAAVDDRINDNETEGDKIPGQYIPVGQAFFVNTTLDSGLEEGTEPLPVTIHGGDVIIKNSQRIFKKETGSGTSIFHSQEKKGLNTSKTKSKEEDTRSKIWLKFRSPLGYHRQILVTADSNATESFDLGYDALLMDDNPEDMYWFFLNRRFVIQGVNGFTLDQELNLGIKVQDKGELRIGIDQLKDIPDEMNILLRDSLLQVTHDLREEDYVTESEAGTFGDRFKLVFQDKWAVQEPEEPVLEDGPIEVIYVNGTREILIKNPELLDISRVYLNNMLGQQVHVYYNVPVEREVPLPVQRFSSGVYIVKLHTEQGIITKKVILE